MTKEKALKAVIYKILMRYKADEPLCCQYVDAGHISTWPKVFR